MKVRDATDHDVEEIVRVGRASFAWAFAHLFTPDVLARYLAATYSTEKISASLSRSDNVYFMAESQGDVVGFLKLKRNCPHHLIEDAD